MTATESRITGLCSCCDQLMWADRFEDRGFRVHASAGVCSECPADVPVAPITIAGTEWVYTARGWEAPEDVETEGKVETVAEDRGDAITRQELDDLAAMNGNFETAEYEGRRDQLATWHDNDQAAQAAGDAEVAL